MFEWQKALQPYNVGEIRKESSELEFAERPKSFLVARQSMKVKISGNLFYDRKDAFEFVGFGGYLVGDDEVGVKRL